MRRIVLSAALCLLARGPAAFAQGGAGACGVSEAAWAYFKNYLAWSESWWSRNYFGGAERIRVESVRAGERAFWFLPASKFLVGYWAGDKGSQISGNTCDREAGAWTPCIPPASLGELNIPAMLLGGTPPAKPMEFSEVCRADVGRSEVPPWRPSGDNPEKKAILSRIEAALRQAASRDGSLTHAVVGDFNMHDPVAYTVADVKDGSGRDERVLMFVDISSAGAVSAVVTRREEPGAGNSRLLERILDGGIEIR